MNQHIYLNRDQTYKAKYTMERLAQGETAELPPARRRRSRRRPRPNNRPCRPSRPGPSAARARAGAGARESGEFRTLSLGVQPSDATVLIDGERWDWPDTQTRLVVRLPDGNHRIEIAKEGFDRYVETIRIRRGETFSLNASPIRSDTVPLSGPAEAGPYVCAAVRSGSAGLLRLCRCPVRSAVIGVGAGFSRPDIRGNMKSPLWGTRGRQIVDALAPLP